MHSWLGRQPPSRKGSRDSKTSEHSVGRDQGVLTNVGIAVERAETNVPVVHAYEFVNDYFDVNHDALQMKMKNIASDELDTRALEDILNGFIESSKVLIKGLKALGHLHPFIINGYSVTNYYEFDRPTLNVSPEFAQIEGTWSGHYTRQYGDNWVNCILRVSIRLDSQPKITGKGEDFAGAFEFMGLSQAHHTYLDFTFIVEDEEDGSSRTCTGRLQRASDTIVAQWKTTHGGGTGELEEAFTLQRTPPSLLRYKYTPQQFAEDPVRSRWAFACSSALHQAQAKLWSRRFFEEKFQARRRYVKLTTRALIVQLGLSPYIPLTQTENQELESLRQELDPSEARFYQALSEFEIQKLSWHPAPSKRNFTHQASHTIVKVEQTLHDYHIVQVVNAARAASKRAKAQLASLESSTVRRNSAGSIHHNDQNASSQCCTCCGRGIWLPCWVCAVCPTDVFICSDCDNKHASCAADNGHLSTHPLVRIHDVAFSNIAATTLHDDYYRALDRRLDAIESNIQKEFTALEARENARFASLEARMDSRLNELESRIDAKFQALEAIFRQIVSQTATLPSSCGQEAWEHTRKPSVH
ncbi:hypothetical protein H0H93_011847 [Arthromyces matolae]|nr:hypothetical protein H0H93_011847 [Arthromyces matolae]